MSGVDNDRSPSAAATERSRYLYPAPADMTLIETVTVNRCAYVPFGSLTNYELVAFVHSGMSQAAAWTTADSLSVRENLSDDSCGVGECSGVGAGVVQAEVAAGGFGGEPVVARCDDDSLVFAIAGEPGQIRIVG